MEQGNLGGKTAFTSVPVHNPGILAYGTMKNLFVGTICMVVHLHLLAFMGGFFASRSPNMRLTDFVLYSLSKALGISAVLLADILANSRSGML